MRHKLGMMVGISALMISPALAQNQQPNPNQAAAKVLLQAADKAIGASSVKSFVNSGNGWMGYPGQQFASGVGTPTGGDLPRSDVKNFIFTADLAGKSAKWEYNRVQGDNPTRGGGGGFPVQGEPKFLEFVVNDKAWNVNAQGQATPINPRDAANRQLRLWLHPVSFIQAALADPNAAATDRYFGRQDKAVKVVGFTMKVCDRPQPQCTRRVTGEFNSDNMLERVITWMADPVMGDSMAEFRWSDYRDVGNGVKMPHRIHAHIGDHPLIPGGHNFLDVRFNDVKVNVANAAQAVPDNVRNAPPVTTSNVVATKLADGVVHMGGGSHNSVAVEFKDYVAVTGPGQLMMQTFTDSYTLSDGNQTIELHHVDGLNHSDNMVIAYLPKQKIVVSADMGGPPPAGQNPPVNANAVVLYNNIKRLKLDVTTHVPIHGAPGPQAEFDRIVAPVAARTPQQGGGGE